MKNEIRVYVCDLADIEMKGDFEFHTATDKQKMEFAEHNGTVYSLQGFEQRINSEELDLGNSFIFISNK